MSLPYPSMVFVPLDILTAEEMNQLVANIESLSAGTAYTTTEQVVGTWVDGKPLYRKVYIKNLSSGTETWIDDLNEKNPIRLEGYLFSDSTQTCQPLGQWANPTDSTYSSRIFCDTTTFKAQVNTGWSRTAYTKIRAILWYTKTTD